MPQRERVLEAMMRIAANEGYEATAINDVIERAGVSAESFGEMFADKEDCFLQAYDAAIDVLVADVSGAFEKAAGAPWTERIAAALRAMVDLLAAEADIARMAIVEVAAVGEDARIHYRAALERFVPFLDEGRSVSPGGADLPDNTAQFAIGGGASLLYDEIRADRAPELPQILPQLFFAVTMPYLGAATAEAEMQRI
jgi:AcrR family transcriptional regulator